VLYRKYLENLEKVAYGYMPPPHPYYQQPQQQSSGGGALKTVGALAAVGAVGKATGNAHKWYTKPGKKVDGVAGASVSDKVNSAVKGGYGKVKELASAATTAATTKLKAVK